MDELNADRAVYRDLVRRACGSGGCECERGTHGFPADAATGRSVGAGPAEVVFDDGTDLGLECRDRGSQARPHGVARAAQRVRKRRRHAANSRVARRRPRSSRAAARPLRTAPSIVAGQPVLVHAAAT